MRYLITDRYVIDTIISTSDKGQTTDNQLRELKKDC
jgi:hypothetical protein